MSQQADAREKIVARPTKWRKIENIPSISYFAPADGPTEGIEEIVLFLEELEAIRLKDVEGLEQAECAQRMEVSRPTFQRILLSAREKTADSLIHGKAIRIDGGNFCWNHCNGQYCNKRCRGKGKRDANTIAEI